MHFGCEAKGREMTAERDRITARGMLSAEKGKHEMAGSLKGCVSWPQLVYPPSWRWQLGSA